MGVHELNMYYVFIGHELSPKLSFTRKKKVCKVFMNSMGLLVKKMADSFFFVGAMSRDQPRFG